MHGEEIVQLDSGEFEIVATEMGNRCCMLWNGKEKGWSLGIGCASKLFSSREEAERELKMIEEQQLFPRPEFRDSAEKYHKNWVAATLYDSYSIQEREEMDREAKEWMKKEKEIMELEEEEFKNKQEEDDLEDDYSEDDYSEEEILGE